MKNLNNIFLILSLFLLTSCSLDLKNLLDIHEWKTYTIEKDKHYSNGYTTRVNTLSSYHIDFIVKFDETAIYKTTLKSNQADINKLYGFTDCNALIHECSARFGWVWNDARQKLECWTYVYSNSKSHYKFIGDINFGEEMSYSIYCVDDHYNFNFNGNLITMPRGCNQKATVRFYVYPYFGGDETAPHQINIRIKD